MNENVQERRNEFNESQTSPLVTSPWTQEKSIYKSPLPLTAGFAETIEELLVIDMGVVGDGCSGDETLCSICAKDSSGPYDFEMRKKLIWKMKKNGMMILLWWRLR